MRAKGEGSIRKRPNGTWEARITIGRDPGTGKLIRRSIYGKKQQDVKNKMQAIQAQLNSGDYTEPSNLTVEDWMKTWLEDYTNHLKPRTKTTYAGFANNHIIPLLGKAKIQKLQPHDIQKAYNKLSKTLSPKTVHNVHGVLHEALSKAVSNGIIKANPSDLCTLPKLRKAEIRPLTEEEMRAFIWKALEKDEGLVQVIDLMTGMRQSEILGLTWDHVDLENNTIHIRQQLQLIGNGVYQLTTPKHDKMRDIVVPDFVIQLLRRQKTVQKRQQMAAGPLWDNPQGFVFTDELGDHLKRHTVYKRFKKIAEAIGCPEARFHDLRHTYAVSSLRAGDDIKTLQDNLGHHSAAFTLDTYGHVTEEMKRESAERQQAFIERLGV